MFDDDATFGNEANKSQTLAFKAPVTQATLLRLDGSDWAKALGSHAIGL